jgi:PAS domain S-box-containing protein
LPSGAEASLTVDSSGTIQSANDEALSLLGYVRDELVGRALDVLLPARLREGHRAHVARFFEHPAPRRLPLGSSLLALHRDGYEMLLDIALTPVRGEGGSWQTIAVLRPHEQGEVERALRERLNFEALITEISAGVAAATAETIDEALVGALERLRVAASVDRAVFLEYTDDWTAAIITHVAYGEGIPRIPERVNVRELFPWTDKRLRSGEIVCIPDVSALPPEADVDRSSWKRPLAAALLIVPIFSASSFRHVLLVDTAYEPREWSTLLASRMRLLGEVMVNAQLRNRHASQLSRAVEELTSLKQRLESENLYLRDVVEPSDSPDGIVATSEAMLGVIQLVRRVAATDSIVLLLGETGTGKEMLARAIHRLSRRRDRLLVAVNCAALPASLVESELFGREKGAYTGALSRQPGRFELADHSTLFLDEIGEMPLELQAKLLRVLETGEFERLGSPRTLKVDVRVVAATNRDLSAAVAAGTFRKDLYYRLSVVPISIPPLRDRPEDIPALVRSVATELGERMGRRVTTIPRRVIERLQRYAWPGNVRELRNVVERALILGSGSSLDIPLSSSDPAIDTKGHEPPDLTLEESERRHIVRTLQKTAGRIRGKGGAAERLGVHEATLRSRMKVLGIARKSD